MAHVSLSHISKVYEDGAKAVDDFSLEVEDREFLVLVGPSGCGKTTTLRMIAGLEEITEGELRIDGELVNDVKAKDRDIAMVFQNYALYPHMTVFDNMAFGLKMRKVPKDKIEAAVLEAADILGLTPYLKRKPKELSGGQKQRVAMGRAIVREPKVFLMDEPLSNLDAKLRGQMRVELTRLQRRLGATIVYVTHDQTEAMTLGTRIVVMKDGLIQQVDSPRDLYRNPANMFVAAFIGAPQMNFISTRCERRDGRLVLAADGVVFGLSGANAEVLERGGYEGCEVVLGIRPEDILVSDFGQDAARIEATLRLDEMLGAESILYLDSSFGPLTVRVEGDALYEANCAYEFGIPQERMHFFDAKTEAAISALHA